MNRLHGQALALISLGFILGLASCSPAKQTLKQPLKEEGSEHVFELLKKNELQYEWLSAKFNAKVTIDKQDVNMNGQLRICRDSVIWVSIIPALGLEAARILITQDSVKFLNRIENTYLFADFSFINDHLNSGFDFDMLQALMVGNDMRYYENDVFKADVDGYLYRLSTPRRMKLKKYVRNSLETLKVLVQSLWIDPATGKISKLHIKESDKDNKKLEVDYSDFVPVDDQLFPSRAEYKIEAEKHIKISVEFSRIKINEALGLPFSVPSGFSRIQQN